MPTWIGDAVMATPALRALRKRYPSAHVELLAGRAVGDVMSNGPWMDDVVFYDRGRGALSGLGSLLRYASKLRARRYDLAILLSNSFRSALLVRLAGVRRRVGYARDGRSWLLTDRIAAPRDEESGAFRKVSTLRYYNALVRELGCDDPGEQMELYTSAADEAAVEKRLTEWGVADHHPLVVLNPGGSFGPSKLWLTERYAAVADRLIEERNAQVVIAFGRDEEGLARRVCNAMHHKALVVDRPAGTIGELKALIRRCDLLLINDTGPRHFAKAFGKPVVTVFGSTDPRWTQTDYPLERDVRIEVDCGPCQKKVCPLGHHKCMTGVSVEMVFAAACELLDGRSDSGHPRGHGDLRPHAEAQRAQRVE